MSTTIRIEDRKKADFYINQVFHYIQCLSSTQRVLDTLTVVKIGRSYVYFDGGIRYEYGQDFLETYSGGRGKEWSGFIKVERVFDTKDAVLAEKQRFETIDRITSAWQINDFLTALSQELLDAIHTEITAKNEKYKLKSQAHLSSDG